MNGFELLYTIILKRYCREENMVKEEIKRVNDSHVKSRYLKPESETGSKRNNK